jgi:hypothetical protein
MNPRVIGVATFAAELAGSLPIDDGNFPVFAVSDRHPSKPLCGDPNHFLSPASSTSINRKRWRASALNVAAVPDFSMGMVAPGRQGMAPPAEACGMSFVEHSGMSDLRKCVSTPHKPRR